MGDTVMGCGEGILVLLEGSVVGEAYGMAFGEGEVAIALSAVRYKGSLFLFGGIHVDVFPDTG